jgi:sortase A
VETAAWVTGIVTLAAVSAAYLDGALGSRLAIQEFATLQAAAQGQVAKPDLALWSRERIDAWRRTLSLAAPPPLAVMKIPRLRLEVPIFAGTDDVALNRGAGHIEDTAPPGTPGNSGIAGHRDGFLRGLKDLAAGDTIELETLNRREVYRVERIWIVTPDDVSVLDPTTGSSITLVTCYPFYFVGAAPKRYIVRAVLMS